MEIQFGPALISGTDISQNESVKVGQTLGFAKLLSGLLQPISGNEVEVTVNQDLSALSSEELLKVIELLQAADVTEIESGSALLEQLLSGDSADLSKLILEQLQLNEEDIRSAITTFLQGIRASNHDVPEELSEKELSKLLKELPDMDVNEALMSLLQILPSVPSNQLSISAEQNGVQLAKTLKLLELFLYYEQPNVDNTQLNKLLQNTAEKLKTFLNGNDATGKNEILNKVFNPFVKEVNQSILAKGQMINEFTGLEQADSQSMKDINQNHSFTPNGSIHSFSFLTKQEQLVLLQEQSGQFVSKDELIKQFETILAKSQFVTSGGSQKLFIKLYPEHLGALRIELTQQDSLLTAKILTTTATAKDVLESQIQGLRQAFLAQNLQVDRIEIAQQFQQEQFMSRDPQKDQKQQQPREQNEQEDGGNQTNTVSFEEFLLNVEA